MIVDSGPRSVTVEVPVRACDVGGWTDTWFAGHGRVCSLAVGPAVSVRARAAPGTGAVTIVVPAYETSFTVGSEPAEHRLLAEAVRQAGTPVGEDVEIMITASVPPATSLGTSASVCVGVIAVLDALRGEIRPPSSLASAAHAVEVERLGRQSGVQDQAAAAHGGANLIDIVRYPRTTVRRLDLPVALAVALDARLAHVAYGGPHDSSAVHIEVIGALADEGPSAPRLERLRQLAAAAGRALAAEDLDTYGAALTEATEVQAALHPALVSDAAHELIAVAGSSAAIGWKVNGAGGPGGSISILCRDGASRDRIIDEARRLGHQPLQLRLALRGARIEARSPSAGSDSERGRPS